jgi:hypothetical protein
VKYYTMCAPVDDVERVPPRGAPKSPAAKDVLQPAAQNTPQPELETPQLQELADPEFAPPMEDDANRLDAFHGDTPVCYRQVNNIVVEVEPVPGQVERVLARA